MAANNRTFAAWNTELSNVSFSTWIKPLKVYDVINNTVFIMVNMNSSVEYIEKKYLLPLKVCIAEITGEEYEVSFISEDDDRLNEIQNMAVEASQKKRTKSVAERAGLNPKYTFDTFVVGGNNSSPMQFPLRWRNRRDRFIILYFSTEVSDWERLIWCIPLHILF